MARPKPKKNPKIGAKQAVRKNAAVRSPGELVIITGMSGSGKASVLKAFEDLGYYCVDNLPVELIPRFAELVGQSSEIERTALVVDVREGTQLEGLPAIVNSVKRMLPTKVLLPRGAESMPAAAFQRDSPAASPGHGHAGKVVAGCGAPALTVRYAPWQTW